MRLDVQILINVENIKKRTRSIYVMNENRINATASQYDMLDLSRLFKIKNSIKDFK